MTNDNSDLLLLNMSWSHNLKSESLSVACINLRKQILIQGVVDMTLLGNSYGKIELDCE